MSDLANFLASYQRVDQDNLNLLNEMYSADVEFVDPIHHICGLEPLIEYFSQLYQNIREISFEYNEILEFENTAYVQWVLRYRQKSLAGGNQVNVPGTSFLRFSEAGKVIYHRDYFDVGAMIYEHLPLMGSIVRRVKKRIGT